MRKLSPQKSRATVRLLLEGYPGKLTLLQNTSQGLFCAEGGCVSTHQSLPLPPPLWTCSLCSEQASHLRATARWRRPLKARWGLAQDKSHMNHQRRDPVGGKRGEKNQHKGLLLLRFKIPAFLFSHSSSVRLTTKEKSASCPSLKAHSSPEVSPAVPIATCSVTHPCWTDSAEEKRRYLEEKDAGFHTIVLSNEIAKADWVPGKDSPVFFHAPIQAPTAFRARGRLPSLLCLSN